jgi:1-acyl-sn-glycerol-3-phosphate acyltransferase
MRTIIAFLLYVVLAVLLLPVLLVCYLGRWSEPLIAIGKWALSIGSKILAIQVRFSGLERIDKKRPYVFMANHLSLIDGPLIFWLIPQSIRVILKKEVFRIPIIGQGMKHVGFVPVDRKRLRGGKKSIERATRLIKEKGFSFLIFPEGTRSRDGEIQPFKRGGFFLALGSQVPVVPISIQGTYEMMPRGSFFVKKGRVKVEFHHPFPVSDYNLQTMPQLIEKVRNTIKNGLK